MRLSETVSRLTLQLEQEREKHASVTRSLHTVAEEGRTKVSAGGTIGSVSTSSPYTTCRLLN